MSSHAILIAGGYGVVGHRIADLAPDYPDRVVIADAIPSEPTPQRQPSGTVSVAGCWMSPSGVDRGSTGRPMRLSDRRSNLLFQTLLSRSYRKEMPAPVAVDLCDSRLPRATLDQLYRTANRPPALLVGRKRPGSGGQTRRSQ
jgi:hypothetical protein